MNKLHPLRTFRKRDMFGCYVYVTPKGMNFSVGIIPATTIRLNEVVRILIHFLESNFS